MITTGQLKLSFEANDIGRKSKREDFSTSGQLLDFEYVAEDYVETALVDSFGNPSSPTLDKRTRPG
jgi:hypothetical protein